MSQCTVHTKVAVIGAGPGGLVAARWLLAEGFDTHLFEQGPELGGQWTGEIGASGVWPTLYTNTSRILTAFSDLPHDGDQTFLSARQILRYLHRYAEMFRLKDRIRLSSKVIHVKHGGGRWSVETADGAEAFDRVVIASGRFQTPALPPVPGLSTFSGPEGVRSTFDYRGVEPYRGKRVLVGGCAVSALEVAAELAHGGAAAVTVTQRRQRYVLPKFAAGVPSDHRIFTRYGALAAERLPVTEVDRQLKTIVTDAGGSPEQYGAPTPDPSLFAAGVTLSQDYLPLVAEGRIDVRPWPLSVSGPDVTFADGGTQQFDGLLFGTGFRLDLPFLADEIRETLGLDDVHLDADRYTFHPDLPGLAFVGMWDQSGGYFVPLELQARWLAYTWSGRVPGADLGAQRAAVEAYRARRGLPQKTRMNLAAIGFARAAGCEPQLDRWPELRRALLFGPLAPSCFRLDGPDALPDAAEEFARAAAAFGAIESPEFTDREQADWNLLQSH
ncbi:flavin-containing monooxygenase [Mycolicibacterium obuense]|uniref:flavin-containing monooxygenase n=1 Tax=Mycolicibacterium obuense TaxID=1807 RepID=UPI001F29066C|nr:NAD(P)-binding domain-containing protein [Mycolicibacterium obuense]